MLKQADELSAEIDSLERQVTALVQSWDDSRASLEPDSQGQNGSQSNSKKKDSTNGRDIESGVRKSVKDRGLARSYDAGSDDEDSDHGDDEDGEEGRGDDDEIMSESSYDDRFKELEEEVATLVADVHDLALYTKLNFTGFVKIVKVSRRLTLLMIANFNDIRSNHCVTTET